jgi:hypothetical protein
MGEIRGESTVEIEVPVFDADGNRVYTDKFNPDGTPVLENGVQVTAPATKKQSVVLISEYVPA